MSLCHPVDAWGQAQAHCQSGWLLELFILAEPKGGRHVYLRVRRGVQSMLSRTMPTRTR